TPAPEPGLPSLCIGAQRSDIRFPPYILQRPSRAKPFHRHHGARMPPTLILLVGMATILAGIVLLRLNAFLALIIAAIVVSLLAPGEPAVKIARVAEGLGRTAGTVVIVVVLGAIVGEAMTDSGSED